MNIARNLLAPDSNPPGEETIEVLLKTPGFTLEHIVSRGAPTPEGFWYDQDRDEWVLLIRGEAGIRYDSGELVALKAGDPLVIPAHRRHRVETVSDDAIWLAMHYEINAADSLSDRDAGDATLAEAVGDH